MTITDLFEEARARIAVPDDVLKEARERRDLIKKIAEEEFPTLRTFSSGSLAHGTQNDPLNDADVGIVLDRRVYDDLGPDGKCPCAIVEEVRAVLRERLKEDFPNAHFYTGGRRAIRINFMEPIEPSAGNFTVDLIVAIRREEGGLWIPDLDNDEWDPSHPERHTELIVDRNKSTGSHFARTLRLAKHANARHGKTIFSFNVAALGLEAVTEKVSLPEGLTLLLRHAADSLDKGLTEDPAGVSGPIKLNISRRKDAAKRFKALAELAEEALELDAEGQMAQAQRNWSKVLTDAIDSPSDEDLKTELAAGLRNGNERVRQGAGGMVVSSQLGRSIPATRAYGDRTVTQKELARRLKSARENTGLTQQEVAEEVGIARTAVVQIEAGKRAVNSLELAEMARLYGRGIADFLSEGPFEADPLVALFRAAPDYAEDRRLKKELLRCVDLCREAANLERLLGLSPSHAFFVSYALGAPSTRWEAISQGRYLSEQERNRLDLGTSPVWETAEIIARQGVRVTEYQMPDTISGLFFHSEDVGFAVVVNRGHGRRRRLFSYAHEYCHLLADRDRFGGISHAGNKDELAEVRANAFAAHFLMPEAGVRSFLKALGKGEATRQNLEIYDEWNQVSAQKRMPAGSQELRIYDVVGMSHHFGVSYEAALYHLLNLRLLRKDSFEALWAQKEVAEPVRQALRIPEWDEGIHWYLAEQVLSLAFEAYRRDEISRNKLIELAEKSDVDREEIEAVLHDIYPHPEPIEAIVPDE